MAHTLSLHDALPIYLDVVHIKWGTSRTLGLDNTTRPAGGDRVPGAGRLGDGGDEDEEREGRQSWKAELEEKLKDLSQRPDIYEYLARAVYLGDGGREKRDFAAALWWDE